MSTIINEGSNASYYVSPTGVTISGRIKSYSTIAERNAETSPPNFAVVLDATTDPTVKTGSAMYAYSNGSWTKIYEVESMDLDEKFTWDNIIGGPGVTADAVVSAVTKQHTHSNLNVLSRLSTDSANTLTFDGIAVNDNTSNAARLDIIEPIVASSSAKLLTIDATIQSIQEELATEGPVTSVNNQTGAVVITLDDIDTTGITDRLDTIEPIVTAHTTTINTQTYQLQNIMNSLVWHELE